MGDMDVQIDLWQQQGSGFVVSSVDEHHLSINRYNPLGAGSWVELPKWLQNSRKGLINIKNEDNECFRWCHVRYLNPQEKDQGRIKKSDREIAKKLDYTVVDFPVETKHFGRKEKETSIRVNEFG